MARSLWFLIPKNFNFRLTALFFTVLFGILLAFNFVQYRSRTIGGKYLFSEVTFLEIPSSVKVNQSFTVKWNISAPTPRDASQTLLVWGSVSTESAFLTTPENSPYTQKSLDYVQGPFRLPDSFEARTTLAQPGVVYFRVYSLIDNRPTWSEEKRVLVE